MTEQQLLQKFNFVPQITRLVNFEREKSNCLDRIAEMERNIASERRGLPPQVLELYDQECVVKKLKDE
jgi:hypothetical protein